MTPIRILVVDDEPGMLRAAERVLGRRYEVITTPSPQEALDRIQGLAPDLAILDIRMPGIDGFDLMARLKAVQPDLDVILMTGSISDLDRKLIRAIRENAFYFIQKPFDAELLRTLVERCVELKELARENRRHVRRLESEMAEAEAFQKGLLPPRAAVVEGIGIECRYAPCSELGGDIYDYASAGPGAAALLMVDVSGHGVSAAMLTGIVKSAFHSSMGDGFEPQAVVQRVSTAMSAFGPDRFVTLICARIIAASGRLEYVNAGHPSALLWGSEGVPRRLESTGPIISPAFSGDLWSVETLVFGRDQRLLLYTDGVPEARAGQGFFGEDGIMAAVERHRKGGAPLLDDILEAVRAASGGRPQPDDLTLLTAGMV